MSFVSFSTQALGRLDRRALLRGVIVVCSVGAIGWLLALLTPYTQPPQSSFYGGDEEPTSTRTHLRATVTAVKNDTTVTAVPIDGEQRTEQEFTYFSRGSALKPGDTILLSEQRNGALGEYVTDTWRWPGIVALVALFVIVVYIAIGKRGIHGIIGLLLGVGLLFFWAVPAILHGTPAYLALTISAYFIGLVSVFVAHGMNRRALVSAVVITILLTFALVIVEVAMQLAHITGYGDHMAMHMYDTKLDLRGIFAGSMLIATVGILEDAVTTQVATVAELHHSRPSLSAKQLFTKGYAVGKEHIAALINTLVLAYAGVSMLTILAYATSTSYPLLTLINSEFIASEIIRALVSNIVLVAAIPLSTLLAVWAIQHRQRVTTTAARILTKRLPGTQKS